MQNIRNFSIIAHIDHGKSTLADRLLELTGTIEKRVMREQVLDSMELERERGITIKMQPVRMRYKEYILNLIDTPGHIDFSYEVSRALRAVEGSILLIDATQGVQAQTLSVLAQAKTLNLVIIPVISKIDSPLAKTEEVREEVVKLLGCLPVDVLLVSGKTGEGVGKLLDAIIDKIPSPQARPVSNTGLACGLGALVFDFKYSNHKGVIVFVRVFSGKVARGDRLKFQVAGEEFSALEVGIFSPEEKATASLSSGEIGYIVTGIKEPGIASVGDTISFSSDTSPALPGYESPRPVVWASVYPENADHFNDLKFALSRLRLSDSAFTFEEEYSGTLASANGKLGKGFRCGFLGMLHLEIITERLRREFALPLVVTLPSVTYRVVYKTGNIETVYSPSLFPDEHLIAEITEPWAGATVIVPPEYLSIIIKLLHEFEALIGDNDSGFTIESMGHTHTAIHFELPLRELMRGFFDRLKSVTAGYGSISYSLLGERMADVTRLDIIVADERVSAFTKVISRKRAEEEAERAVEKLSHILPRQMFTVKIQGRALGRIISSKTLSGMRKDVTQHMYGGDITRKMKLREKQKKGKKKMKERGEVNIPQEVFLKMIQ